MHPQSESWVILITFGAFSKYFSNINVIFLSIAGYSITLSIFCLSACFLLSLFFVNAKLFVNCCSQANIHVLFSLLPSSCSSFFVVFPPSPAFLTPPHFCSRIFFLFLFILLPCTLNLPPYLWNTFQLLTICNPIHPSLLLLPPFQPTSLFPTFPHSPSLFPHCSHLYLASSPQIFCLLLCLLVLLHFSFISPLLLSAYFSMRQNLQTEYFIAIQLSSLYIYEYIYPAEPSVSVLFFPPKYLVFSPLVPLEPCCPLSEKHLFSALDLYWNSLQIFSLVLHTVSFSVSPFLFVSLSFIETNLKLIMIPRPPEVVAAAEKTKREIKRAT